MFWKFICIMRLWIHKVSSKFNWKNEKCGLAQVLEIWFKNDHFLLKFLEFGRGRISHFFNKFLMILCEFKALWCKWIFKTIWEIIFWVFKNHVINIECQKYQNTLTPRKRGFIGEISSLLSGEIRTGGKPSTWFPPGGLVEHISIENSIRTSHWRHSWRWFESWLQFRIRLRLWLRL